MKDVAQNIVAADHEQAVEDQKYPGVTVDDNNYFEIASENRLGTKQHYQFQPTGVQGTVIENGKSVKYYWGSTCTAEGICDPSAEIETNLLAQMPREYISEYNVAYYNFYAASAESILHSNVPTVMNDTICPSGWSIPSAGNAETANTYGGLLNAYGLGNNLESVRASTKIPLSLVTSGAYVLNFGFSSNTYGSIWTSSIRTGNGCDVVIVRGEVSPTLYTPSNDNRPSGHYVRCMFQSE